jgi:methyl-accepting chemotaxis protein
MNLADYDRKYKSDLEREVNNLRVRAKSLNAFGGEQRLALVAEHFSNLSLEQASNMLDTDAFRREVEDVQAYKRKAKSLQFGRIVLGLAPLIVTWASMSWAVLKYVDMHRLDQAPIPSFLQQWQQGLPGDPITFFWTGVIDVSLLLLFLIFTVFSLRLEYRARSDSEEFARELQSVTDGLMKAVASEGIKGVTSDDEIERIVRFIKVAIAESYQDLEGVIVDVKNTIVKAGETMENMFNNTITPMLTRFDSNTSNFRNDLNTLNDKVKEIASASTTMATSSTEMATSAKELGSNVHAQTLLTKELDGHLIALNTTEQNMTQTIKDTRKDVVTEIQQVAGSMNGAAHSVFTAANDMKSSATKVEDIGKQLAMIDAANITAITNQITRVIYEAANVANTLNQANANLRVTIQELQNAVRGGYTSPKRKKFWHW